MNKPKILKCVFLEATFPELPASKAFVTGRGEASSLRVAASRAMADLFHHKNLRARRVTAAKITLSVGQRSLEGSQDPEGPA